ncbi:MAG: DUF6114 domain-containing protein [Candidatus Bathyarchaeia archaeon]
MKKKIENWVSILLIIGAVLIIINGLMNANACGVIVLSTYPVSSVFVPSLNATFPISSLEAINATKSGLWGRISFGLQGIANGPLMPLLLVIAVANLWCALMLYLNPEKHTILAPLTVLFSILSMLVGGGFIIGTILGVIGGCAMIQWPKPFKETFIGKIIRAAKFDKEFYSNIGGEPQILRTALLTLIFINVLSGLGNGLYVYNVNKVLNPTSLNVPFRILFLGELFLDLSVVNSIFSFIGLAVVKWIIFSIILFFVGSKLVGKSVEFDEIAVVLAFVYVPVCLQFFMPFVFLRQPLLEFEWPFTVVFLTNLWMFMLLMIALRQKLNISMTKAFGTAIFTGSIYWLINSMILIPTFTQLHGYQFPGVIFSLQPVELALGLVTISTLIALVFGAFSRR